MTKKYLERTINKLYKTEIDEYFGKDSKIIIESCFLSTNTKKWSVSAKLVPTNHYQAIDIYPYGLEILITDAWKFTGKDKDIIITTSIDHSNGPSYFTF